MTPSIKELEKQLHELTIKKIEVEMKMMEAVGDAVKETTAENRHKIRKLAPNCFVINVKEIVGNPWNPHFYDWEQAVKIVMKFLESKSVENWKSELQHKLDEAQDKPVVFVHTYYVGGQRFSNSIPVDPEFIKKIIEKL